MIFTLLLPSCTLVAVFLFIIFPGLVAAIPLPTSPTQASIILHVLHNILAVTPQNYPPQASPARHGPISQLELCSSPLLQKPLQTPSQILFHGVYFKMELSSTAANWYWVPVIYRSYYKMPRKWFDVCFNPPLGTLRWSWWYKKETSDSYYGLQDPYICRHFFSTFTCDLFMQLEPAAHWLFLYLYSFCTLLVCKDFWESILRRGHCIHF